MLFWCDWPGVCFDHLESPPPQLPRWFQHSAKARNHCLKVMDAKCRLFHAILLNNYLLIIFLNEISFRLKFSLKRKRHITSVNESESAPCQDRPGCIKEQSRPLPHPLGLLGFTLLHLAPPEMSHPFFSPRMHAPVSFVLGHGTLPVDCRYISE